MKPNIEISDQHLKEITTVLNKLLANEYVLYTKTWAAHWNMQGPNFITIHEFLGEQYGSLNLMIDDLAERIRSLGHFALGSLKDFLSVTDMLEDASEFGSQRKILQTLTNDHETIIRSIRNEISPIADEYKDLGTADFVTGLMEKHEKMAWKLRAHFIDGQ